MEQSIYEKEQKKMEETKIWRFKIERLLFNN